MSSRAIFCRFLRLIGSMRKAEHITTIHRFIIVCVLSFYCLFSLPMSAQKYAKYYLEFGVLGGGSFYLGDVNEKLFVNMQPTAGAFLKYKLSGHWEIKLQGTGGWVGIQNTSDGLDKTLFGDMAVIGEFNFFNYAAGKYEAYASNITPYIFLGLGTTIFNSEIAAMVPFGLGFKWRIGHRWNVGAYWSAQKIVGSDNFDGVDDPYHLNNSVWNNTDWYSTVGVTLSLDFWRICAPCHNGVPYRRVSY